LENGGRRKQRKATGNTVFGNGEEAEKGKIVFKAMGAYSMKSEASYGSGDKSRLKRHYSA
jgi:hypothetical protein